MSELRVRLLGGAEVPVAVRERDADGLPVVVVCPCCGDDATVQTDGSFRCPLGVAVDELLAGALGRLGDLG